MAAPSWGRRRRGRPARFEGGWEGAPATGRSAFDLAVLPKLSTLKVCKSLFDLVERIHDEGTMAHDRLAQRHAGDQQDARAAFTGRQGHAIAVHAQNAGLSAIHQGLADR